MEQHQDQLFVAHCIAATLTDEVLPKHPLGARKWERFGMPVDPRVGAILVFWRSSQDTGKGHVGFCAGEDSTGFLLLGGNQSNKVSYAWIAKSRLTAARWPTTAQTQGSATGIVRITRGAENLSFDEA